jgi:amino acid transporter
MLPAMLAGAALATGLLVLIAILAVHVMGADFLGAAGYVTFAHPDVWPFPSQPALYALITISHPHAWLAVLLGVSFVAGITGTILPSYLMLTRNSLAWAIDRVVPPIFGEVSPRTHTPLFSTVFMIVVSVGYLLLAVYHWASDIVLLFAIVALMAIFVWMCTGIAAVLFPYTARKMFEDSPVNRRVGGIRSQHRRRIDAAIMALHLHHDVHHWGSSRA